MMMPLPEFDEAVGAAVTDASRIVTSRAVPGGLQSMPDTSSKRSCQGYSSRSLYDC